jgi:LPS-assembly protein
VPPSFPVLVAALVALVARLASAAPPALPPGVAGAVEVTGDRVTYEPGTGKVLLEGNAVVRRGAVVLRARSAEWDPSTGEVRASGHVLLTDPTRVISADAVRAVIGGEFEAEGVVAFVKDRPVDLSQAPGVAEAGRTGRNALTFSSPSLRGAPDGHLRLQRARLTLCDCPGGAPPSWEVTATEADVVPGDRAILRWPVLRVAPPLASRTYAVPLLRLPWLYVPLGERQSGLLIPTVGSTRAGGFTVNQPLFLTLGRSADATLTGDWFAGHSRSRVDAGDPSIRGPGARLELRWAPAEHAEGRAELAWLHDLDDEHGGAHGDRGALELTHRQLVSDRTAVVAGLHLASDPVWVRDTVADALARSAPYRRSDLTVSSRSDAIVSEAGVSYLQPLDPVARTSPWGPLGLERRASSRLGAGVLDLVPTAVGPLQLSGHLGATRFAALDHQLDAMSRPAMSRADARAEVAAPVLLWRALTLAPYLRGAALGYAPDGGPSQATAWGIAGAVAETEVSRRFGEIRHAVAPRLEWRAGSSTVGEPLPTAYDLYDRAAPGLLSASSGGFQQLRASVETRLETASATVLRLELGQDIDLRERRFAEAFTAVGVAAGPLTVDASARWFSVDKRPPGAPAPASGTIPSRLDDVNELRASLGLRDHRGDAVTAGFLSVAPGGSGRLVAGLDPLFDTRAVSVGASGQATFGVRANLGGGARIGYDALLPGRAQFVASCQGDHTGTRRVEPLQVQQHTGLLTWDSPCRCFRLIVTARVDDCGGHTEQVTVELARFGGSITQPPATAR